MNKIESKMIESGLKICEKEGQEIDKKIKKIEQKIDKDKQILNELLKEKRVILKEQNKLLSKKNGSKKATVLTENETVKRETSDKLGNHFKPSNNVKVNDQKRMF